jgi:phosphoribosylaminoimidazolecarboxamide formyltransferase / IMP cyclohydrolase
MARLALLSVSDKTGLVAFATELAALGWGLLSTGGTARTLRSAGLTVTDVSEHTGHPEIMDGRVKTLHPRVHGGILGRRTLHAAEATEHGIPWIDLVVVNLYPFEATAYGAEQRDNDDIVEQIDIGGPSMLRSAAKNHESVTVVVDPADYAPVVAELRGGGTQLSTRQRLAARAFHHTAAYDGLIAGWLQSNLPGALDPQPPAETAMPVRRVQALRYGENPHQAAVFYATPGEGGRSLARAKQLQGKELSFNNLADLDATLRVAFDLEGPAAVIVKHMNPCGAATHPSGLVRAYELALSGDPVSAFGGIVVFNRPVDGDVARAVRQSRVFFEVLAAPGFTDEARELLSKREQLRVLDLPTDWDAAKPAGRDARRVQGGWLLQDWDIDADIVFKKASRRAPSDAEVAALNFAWRISRHVKSNAIVLARAEDGGFVLNGVGAGQMSRVDSVRLAVSKATRDVAGSVLASDAFFPFPDGVEVALSAGVRAFAQPGGSMRDDEVLAAVDAADASMVFTGMRHFRH